MSIFEWSLSFFSQAEVSYKFTKKNRMKLKSQYLGIFLGVIYGLIIRILGDTENFADYYNIYSISFLWVTPIIIGSFPILFSSNEIYKSKAKLFFYPIITVILFLITALITRIEDLVCVLIIGLPFLLVAGLIGLLLGAVVKDRIKKQKIIFYHFNSIVIQSN
ncbi:MAG: hypothetical protein WCY63_04320 [Weeksellaceae bacterium]